MAEKQKISRDFLRQQGFLTPMKRGRKSLYRTPEEAREVNARQCRLANARSYQRFKEARSRYLEAHGTPSEPSTAEPCTA